MDRREWLFPERSGTFDGIELDGLNPDNADDRTVLIHAEHPELSAAIDQGRSRILVGEQTVSPQLHLTMHEVISNQILDGAPPEAWQAAQRLAAAEVERHEVLHMLMSAVSGGLWQVLHDHEPFDLAGYVSALDALPGSWDGQLPGGLGDSGVDDLDFDDGPDFDGDDDPDFDGDDDLDLDDDDLDFDDDDLDVGWPLGEVLDILAERGPMSAEELAGHLDGETEDFALLATEPLVAELAQDRLASVTALLGATVLTHRLSGDEAATEELALGTDLAPLLALLCCGDHIHLGGGEEEATFDMDPHAEALDAKSLDTGAPQGPVLRGPAGWLDGAAAGELIGFRLSSTDDDILGVQGELDVMALGPSPVIEPITDPLCAQLRASFDGFSPDHTLPVPVEMLLNQLAADSPGLVAGTLAPLSTVFEAAGFEVVDRYSAPAGTDWELFHRLHRAARVSVLHDLDDDKGEALMLCSRACMQFTEQPDKLDRAGSRAIGAALGESDLAEAFAHAMGDAPETTLSFLARLRALAGSRAEADLAWVESLVASRCGDLQRAEECLQVGLRADPTHPGLLEDAAWYASDRGEARQALRYLERRGEDEDSGRKGMLRRYAPAVAGRPEARRNDPCPCGSGRKFKRCCLDAPLVQPHLPLPERVAWIWEKLTWWAERVGPDLDILHAVLTMTAEGRDLNDALRMVDYDVAASLVLFEDGAIQGFLRQRSSLLPDDEADLVAQWASARASLYEVVAVRPGEGLDLRDGRTGEAVAVTERRGSSVLEVGDSVFAHPVPDGVGRQLVGGMANIPMELRQELINLLDAGATSKAMATLLGIARWAPRGLGAEERS
ncbi:MAG: DUF1841 family protein [Acidimicrobiales bacterium]